MTSTRLEAFSDAVIAIAVLELRAPHRVSLDDLKPLGPALLSYVLSFRHLGIYWNNHHHLMQVVGRVTGSDPARILQPMARMHALLCARRRVAVPRPAHRTCSGWYE